MKCFIIAVFTHLIPNVVSEETPVNNIEAKYNAAVLLSKIFNTNDTILPKANYDFYDNYYGTQNSLEGNRENIYRYENSVKFENGYEPLHNTNVQNLVKFEENGTKRKRRRKKKPKQYLDQLNSGNVPYEGVYGDRPGLYQTFEGQYYRPRPRPRPSLASEALSAVTEALTSIAMYDDYQCVPRLLCEAAAGGTLGSSGLLQSVSQLQPLLTLLSAYSGFTSNPLFVFGRAVLLGASSDSNPASCRYAYSACPTDPEQLVHYLNNHNGGFFRFFNAPQNGQQNIEQFYNQLSQNYELYQPNQDYNQHYNQESYGNNNQQHYGLHNPNLYSNYNENYGLAYPYQNTGQNIRFKNYRNTNKIEKRIQNKPSTLYIDDLEDENSRWTFPEGNQNAVNYVNNDVFNSYKDYNNNNFNSNYEINHNEQNDKNRYHNYFNNRKGKLLKFPGQKNEDYSDDNHDKNRRPFFPEQQDNEQYFLHNTITENNYENKYYGNQQYLNYNTPVKNNYNMNMKYNSDYNTFADINNRYQYRDEYYANKNKYSNYNNDIDQGVQTVYVVRGNGDPNNPEIHKLRPGQSIY